MSVQKRYSVKNQARMEEPHGIHRIKVPLPRDLDPRVRIDLKNKQSGEIGFQLIRAGNTRAKRLEFLNREIEGGSEMAFPRLTYVDRAMVSTHVLFPEPRRYVLYALHTGGLMLWAMRVELGSWNHKQH